jgi:site-specific DNA recombinase
MAKIRKIGLYPRVSTKEAAKKEEGSITSQIHRLKMRVEDKNKYSEGTWGKVVEIYEEPGLSGKNTKRPAFQKMLRDVKAGRIDTVMVTELSRISRSVTDFLGFVEDLSNLGADFICLQYDFDTTSPAGKVFMTIIMALAQFERELTVERIKNNIYARSLRGLLNGGRPFLGYDKDLSRPGSLMVNEPESEIVTEVFNLYLKNGSVSSVAKELNSKGFTNKKWVTKEGHVQGGTKFTHSSVHNTLTHLAYIGRKEINKANKDKDQNDLKPEERYSIVDASWEPIVDKSIFDNVKKKLDANKVISHKATHDYILSGLLFCDECGSPLFGQASTGRNAKHHYYSHSKNKGCKLNRIPVDKIEDKIRKTLFSLIRTDQRKQEFVKILNDLTGKGQKTYTLLAQNKEKELKEIKKRKINLMKVLSFTDDEDSVKSILAEVKELEAQNKQIEVDLEKANIKSQDEARCLDTKTILAGINSLKGDNFRKKTLSSKKAIIRSIIKSIHINPENVIRIDVWGGKNRPERTDRSLPTQPGVVLPFYKKAQKFEFKDIKKPVTYWTPVRVASGLVEAPRIELGSANNPTQATTCLFCV